MPAPSPAPVPRPSRPTAVIVAVAVLGLAAIWALAWERVRFAEDQAVTAERTKNDNLVLAHADALGRELDLVDQLLQTLRDDHLAGRSPAALKQRALKFGTAAGGLVTMTVLDADGDVVTTLAPSASGNFADRDYFVHHARDSTDTLHIGPPLFGRLSQRWLISATRRITHADGSFGGVVYAGLDPARFAQLYERSALGKSGSLALIGLDGITRVRRNGDQVSFGGDVSRSRLFTELQQARRGHYVATAASDGVRRLTSYQQLERHPLVVVVASSLTDVTALTRATATTTWAGAGMASLLVLALAALTARSMRRDAMALARTAAAERRSRLLLDNSFDAILHTRPDGQVLTANAAARALFGLDEAGLRAAGRTGLVDTDDPRLASLLAERQRAGRAQGRLRMRRGDGSLFEADINSVLYTDADGQPASSLTVRDLTTVLATEAERAGFERRLREAQKLESIGTLAGGIAHDFNNILAAILANVALLRDELGTGRAGAEPLSRISQAALRARALVQQILTFSRRSPEQRRPQPLQPLLRESAALLRATLPAAVQLELHLPDAPLVVCCDATQVQQVMMNLCTNAWQAMPERRGRVRVTLTTETGDGTEDTRPAGWAVLCVEDDGSGFDAATLERLYEPFFTTKPVGQGTGLGLAVVHGIVTAHGGSITADSTPGRGSTFTVRLPLAAAGAAPADGTAATADAAGELAPLHGTPAPSAGADATAGARVLYVDDDPVLAITVQGLLQRAGWQVNACTNATEALARLRAEPTAFDLVVSDYNMPGLSGLDLAREVAAQWPQLPVVISSGYVSDDLRVRAQALGVREVLLKEYTLERLPSLVRALLARRPAATPAASPAADAPDAGHREDQALPAAPTGAE